MHEWVPGQFLSMDFFSKKHFFTSTEGYAAAIERFRAAAVEFARETGRCVNLEGPILGCKAICFSFICCLYIVLYLYILEWIHYCVHIITSAVETLQFWHSLHDKIERYERCKLKERRKEIQVCHPKWWSSKGIPPKFLIQDHLGMMRTFAQIHFFPQASYREQQEERCSLAQFFFQVLPLGEEVISMAFC